MRMESLAGSKHPKATYSSLFSRAKWGSREEESHYCRDDSLYAKAKGYAKLFWAEGVATAVYILNISPTKAVWDQTPYEAWIGNKHSKRPSNREEGKTHKDELAAIQRNNTWELVDLLAGKHSLGLKWVFKTKYLADGSIEKYKARLVVKGYAQQHGIDYEETFSPVSRFETIRIILAVAVQWQWKLYEFDVKSAFLNGDLKEEVYVCQPLDFESMSNPSKVFRLHKALYGLKQAPRAWYSKIDDFFLKNGFTRSQHEPTLYVKKQGTDHLLLTLSPTDCLVGKQQRNPFPQESTWRASQVLELLHADICGPINPLSNSNKRYIITFIDDYSRKVWVYFLVTKSEAFVVFKQYKSRVEKESGVAIKGLRTDRGGEFTSVEFTNFCNDNGIHRQLTAPYTPQQNGIAERKNRTIMNMVRSMLSGKKLPKTFWPEAVNWTVHILNRSPTLAVRNICPEEAWSGFKPSVAYFKVFGSIAYVHIPDCKRIKLDDKSKKCVFIGVSEESKAYRLYDLVSKRIIVSRDVVFDKEASWDWEKSHKESVLMNLAWGENETLPDAITLAGNRANTSSQLILEFQASMKKMFDMTDLGELRYFLGLEIIQAKDGIFLTQRKYVEDTLNKFHMAGCKIAPTPMNTSEKLTIDDGTDLADAKIYRSLIGRPIYVTYSRPDVAFSVGVLSRFMHNPSKTHFGAAKRVLRYLAGTRNHGIWFRKNKSFSLKGYCDSDWAGSVEDRKSTSAVMLTRNPILHGRTKRMDIKHHYIRELIAKEEIRFDTCRTDEQVAELLTKALPQVKHEELEAQLGVHLPQLSLVNHWSILLLQQLKLAAYISLQPARWKIERVHQVGVSFLEMQRFHGAKKQATVAFSSTEAEYVAVSQLVKLFVMLARNPILHGRTKHIEIKHHYIKELIAKEEIRLETCRSDEQVANLLTKPLPKVKHE
ncbi:retrovirus-related pol polyprotein from transposon TNT 1-94 [Tanacetum coccineum]